MNKIISLLIAVAVIVLFVMNHLNNTPDRNEVITDLPWLVNSDEQGRSIIFGQTLGKSTLHDLVMYAGRDAEIRLFQNRDGSYSLEALLEYVNLGNIVSKLIVQLQATDDEYRALQAAAVKEDIGPSLAHRYNLSPDDEKALMNKTISSLTYTPMYVRLTDEMIEQRFGPAQERLSINENTQHLLYPKIGLDIFIDERGKTVFEYVNPADFQSLRDNLDKVAERAAESQ
jgi:hypothetical protein